MTPENKKQIELPRAYSDNKKSVLEQLLYIICKACSELVKVTNKHPCTLRKYCDSRGSATADLYTIRI